MKLKMKMQANQRRRQQRNLEAMLKTTNKPEGAIHFDPKHDVYYKQKMGSGFTLSMFRATCGWRLKLKLT